MSDGVAREEQPAHARIAAQLGYEAKQETAGDDLMESERYFDVGADVDWLAV